MYHSSTSSLYNHEQGIDLDRSVTEASELSVVVSQIYGLQLKLIMDMR